MIKSIACDTQEYSPLCTINTYQAHQYTQIVADDNLSVTLEMYDFFQLYVIFSFSVSFNLFLIHGIISSNKFIFSNSLAGIGRDIYMFRIFQCLC